MSKQQRPSNQPQKNPRGLAALIAVFLIGAILLANVLARRKASAPVSKANPTNETAAGTSNAPMDLTLAADADHHALTNALAAEGESDIDKAILHLGRGNEYLAANRLDAAIAEYREAIKLNAEDEDSYYNLGLALSRAGRNAEAKKAYEDALRLYPDYVEALSNLGNILVKEGDLDGAIKHFQTGLNLDPNHASSHNNIGNALARKGQFEAAASHFEKAISLKPDFLEAYANLGNAYMTLNRLDDSMRAFAGALAKNPNYPPAQKGYARAQQKKRFGQ